MSTTILALFPTDVLYQIISLLEFSNIIQIISQDDQSFLQLHPSLKTAIGKVIHEKSVIKFNTMYEDSRKTDIPNVYYDYDPRFETKTDCKTMVEFLKIDQFCVDEEIEVEMDVVYRIDAMTEVLDFTEFLQKLRPSTRTKLRLDVTVADGIAYFITHHMNQTRKFNLLGHLKDRLTGISANIASVFGSYQDLQLEQFKNVDTLGFIDGDVTGSFANFKNLTTLKLVGLKYLWRRDDFEFDISQLPLTLKKLGLSHCDRIYLTPSDKELLKTKQFPTIDEFSFQYDLMALPIAIFSALTMMSYAGTYSIKIDAPRPKMFVLIQHLDETLSEFIEEKEFRLKSLVAIQCADSNLLLFATEELALTRCLQITPIEGLSSNLKILYLAGTRMSNTNEIFRHNLSQLTYLNLSVNHDIKWEESNLDFSRYTNLRHLDLGYTGIGQCIDKFIFPDSVETLILDSNELASVLKVSFPRKLKSLDLNNNEIRKLINVAFPDTLEFLNCFYNKIEEVDIAKTNIKTLYLSCGESDFTYPKFTSSINSVQFLKLIGYDVAEFQLPDTLIGLELESCKFDSLNFTPRSSLKYLNVCACPISNINISFPPMLEEININKCDLTGIPPLVGSLQNLKVLRIHSNPMKVATCKFTTTSIEHLSLSTNQIEDVDLQFPENTTTNLKVVAFNDNKLTKFSMTNIGHEKNGVQHANLRELWLIGNNCIKEDEKDAFVASLPASLKYLWLIDSKINWIHSRDHMPQNEFSDAMFVKYVPLDMYYGN